MSVCVDLDCKHVECVEFRSSIKREKDRHIRDRRLADGLDARRSLRRRQKDARRKNR